MEQYIGRLLSKDEVVHHVNEKKDDNRIENLQLMTRSEHIELHNRLHYICTIKGCKKKHYAKGLCKYHYARSDHWSYIKNQPKNLKRSEYSKSRKRDKYGHFLKVV